MACASSRAVELVAFFQLRKQPSNGAQLENLLYVWCYSVGLRIERAYSYTPPSKEDFGQIDYTAHSGSLDFFNWKTGQHMVIDLCFAPEVIMLPMSWEPLRVPERIMACPHSMGMAPCRCCRWDNLGYMCKGAWREFEEMNPGQVIFLLHGFWFFWAWLFCMMLKLAKNKIIVNFQFIGLKYPPVLKSSSFYLWHVPSVVQLWFESARFWTLWSDRFLMKTSRPQVGSNPLCVSTSTCPARSCLTPAVGPNPPPDMERPCLFSNGVKDDRNKNMAVSWKLTFLIFKYVGIWMNMMEWSGMDHLRSSGHKVTCHPVAKAKHVEMLGNHDIIKGIMHIVAGQDRHISDEDRIFSRTGEISWRINKRLRNRERENCWANPAMVGKKIKKHVINYKVLLWSKVILSNVSRSIVKRLQKLQIIFTESQNAAFLAINFFSSPL